MIEWEPEAHSMLFSLYEYGGLWRSEWHCVAVQESPAMESNLYHQLAMLFKENQRIEVQVPRVNAWLLVILTSWDYYDNKLSKKENAT